MLGFAAIGLLLFALYKLVLVDRLGFCYRRLWFVSSEELVLDTVGGLMKAGRIRQDELNPNPLAYLANHPNCCRVDWGGRGVFDRGLMHFGSATVSVTYEMSDEEKKRRAAVAEKYYEYVANYTACGEILDYVGMTKTKIIER